MAPAQNERVWIGGGIAAAVLLAAGAWFGMISPQLSSASETQGQASSAEAQNDATRAKIDKLEQASQDMGALLGSLRSAQSALPSDSGMPEFTRQLAGQAAASHVKLETITVGQPTPMSGQAPATAGGSTSSDSGSAATKPNTNSPANKLFSIQVTVISEGSSDHQQAFLNAIQNDGPRRALVTSVQFSPATDATTTSIASGASMTAQLQVFVAPVSPADAAALAQLGEPSKK